MAASALQQLIDLQRSMYDRALNDARENIGNGSASILKYQKEFEASLPNEFTSISARKVLEAIDRHQVILFGDFHSHKQSQRAFLRILRMYRNRPDHAPTIVALEMFRSKDQVKIDYWMSGKTSDQDLLESVNYDQTWGFPWTNFKPVLEYCKFHAIKVVGLNTANGGKDNLSKRDAHAAMIIQKLSAKNPRARILCMMGEFHLADSHLPKAIQSKSTANPILPLRIFANLDKFFFAIKPEKLHRKDQYLSLDKTTFCVINSPPWMKWHSHSLWEEMRRIGAVRYLEDSIAPDDMTDEVEALDYDDDEACTDDVLDLDYHLRHLQKQLLQFFKMNVSAETLDRFSAIPDNLDSELNNMNPTVRDTLLTRASIDGFAVEYIGRFIYMPEISINNMAAASGQMLFGSISQITENYENPDHLFTVQCLKYTFGYIANKILNPKIPLHDRRQLEAYVASSRGRRLIGQMRQRRNIAQAALDLENWITKNWQTRKPPEMRLRSIPKKFTRLDGATAHELARNLAQMIAEPICRGLIRGKLDTVDLTKWFSQDCKNIDQAKATLASMMTLTGG